MRVGIDLGTTYSVVARYNGSNARTDVIRNKFGKDLTPSVICFLEDGGIVIGEEAKELQKGGMGTIASVFKVSMGSNTVCAEVNGKRYTAEDLSRMMVTELIKQAEESTGEKIESAVITVPAYFDDLQRSATRAAAESAGVKVSKIMNEPTAAAIYYGYKHSDGKNILVYDLEAYFASNGKES
ncbi:MAG: Hsp70 family protein, partial [archaeon]|nr:Hsp70 family protein [archaeon]